MLYIILILPRTENLAVMRVLDDIFTRILSRRHCLARSFNNNNTASF